MATATQKTSAKSRRPAKAPAVSSADAEKIAKAPPGPERNALVVAAEVEFNELEIRLLGYRSQRDDLAVQTKAAARLARTERDALNTFIRDLVPQVAQAERAATNLRKIYEPSN